MKGWVVMAVVAWVAWAASLIWLLIDVKAGGWSPVFGLFAGTGLGALLGTYIGERFR